MLSSMLKCQPKSNKELREITEGAIVVINNRYGQAAVDSLYEEIDELMRKKAPERSVRIIALMLNEEHLEAKDIDETLYMLKEMCLLCEENEEMVSLLERFSSIDELSEVYHKIVFFLRRMELDMQDEECEGILVLCDEWKLPVAYLLMVLKNGAIYDREKAGERLAYFLQQKGYQESADKIILWINAWINQE